MGQFQVGNPGKPKGTKHTKTSAINDLFDLYEKTDNRAKFKKELQQYIDDKGMIAFYQKFIRLVQPRELKVDAEIRKTEIVALEFSDGKVIKYGDREALQTASLPRTSTN